MAEPERWITQVEAARRLDCSAAKVKALLATGDLERRPPPRNRGMPSIGEQSVERYLPVLKEQRRQAAERRRRRELYRNPPDVEHVWLDTAEVAALCQLSRKWVIKQIRLERMPATRHGGQWWVRREHAEVVAAARAFARRADKMQAPGQDARHEGS